MPPEPKRVSLRLIRKIFSKIICQTQTPRPIKLTKNGAIMIIKGI
jgi:hypothetical protein